MTVEEVLKKHRPDLEPAYHIEGMCTSWELKDYVNILRAMEEFAELKVNEQRELMSKHLNMRNVPKPTV